MTDVAAILPLDGQARAGWATLLHALVRMSGGELLRAGPEAVSPRPVDHVELRFSRLPLGLDPRAANASSLAVELLASVAPGSPAFGELAYRRLVVPEPAATDAGHAAPPADAAVEGRSGPRSPVQPPLAESGDPLRTPPNRLDLPGPSGQHVTAARRLFPTRAGRLQPVAPSGPWRLMARRAAAAFTEVLARYPLAGLMVAWFMAGVAMGVLGSVLPAVRGFLAAWGLGFLAMVVLGFVGSLRTLWRSEPPPARR